MQVQPLRIEHICIVTQILEIAPRFLALILRIRSCHGDRSYQSVAQAKCSEVDACVNRRKLLAGPSAANHIRLAPFVLAFRAAVGGLHV